MKKQTKKEVKICKLCNVKIKSKDNYVRLTDYKAGKFFMEGFYHTKCYTDKIKGHDLQVTALKKMAFNLVGRANKMMDQAGVEKESYEPIGR